MNNMTNINKEFKMYINIFSKIAEEKRDQFISIDEKIK